jgi:hypothetical protein
MAATHDDIRKWLKDAQESGSSHLIVVCDTFDYDDYPVPVMPDENVRDIYNRYDDKDMQKVMEVYSLRRDIEEQLNEHRAFHFD